MQHRMRSRPIREVFPCCSCKRKHFSIENKKTCWLQVVKIDSNYIHFNTQVRNHWVHMQCQGTWFSRWLRQAKSVVEKTFYYRGCENKMDWDTVLLRNGTQREKIQCKENSKGPRAEPCGQEFTHCSDCQIGPKPVQSTTATVHKVLQPCS